MSRLINPYKVKPSELKPGDIMAVMVTCHVMREIDGGVSVQFYRCKYPDCEVSSAGIPQGSRLFFDNAESAINFTNQLFPVINYRNENKLDLEIGG